MILLDALYINNSGGKVLLNYLVQVFEKSELNVFYLFDKRCENDFDDIPVNRKIYLKSTTINRLMFYKNNKDKFIKVFCFGNIPPPIKLINTEIFTYFHNLSLLVHSENLTFMDIFLKFVKRIFIKAFSKNTNFYIVQTLSVQKLLVRYLNVQKQNVLIHPFYIESNRITDVLNKDFNSFIYISNGNKHKNHLKLFEAWEILAERGYYPELNLTITDNYQFLIDKIKILKINGLNIINHGFCNPEVLYNKSNFLIYPSLMESFGLGLIESCQANCLVIASDLPYVYDVVEPTKVFNPNDSISIAESIIEVYKNENLKESKLKVSNEIDTIIKLLK